MSDKIHRKSAFYKILLSGHGGRKHDCSYFVAIRRRAFTLIELLVVIAIIGVLSSVVFASMNSARIKARDARRSQDLKALKTAIMLYFDANGDYPCKGIVFYTTGSDCLSTTLVPNYISAVSVDPKYKGQTAVGSEWGREYEYYSTASVRRFYLRAGLEGSGFPQTHNYPGGILCQTAGVPVALFYQDSFYAGYNVVTCGRSVSVGESQ